MPSPVTGSVCGLVPVPVAWAPHVPSAFCLNSVNVIVPVASPPSVVGLIEPLLPVGPPVPGLWAVLASVAVSVTGCPKLTGPAPASVVSVGFLGLTTKHSVSLLSLDGGTPSASSPEKSARQQ